MKLKVFTAFSGYDSQCLALRRAGIDFDLVGWSEIDKCAIKAHDALFPEYKERNFGDICKIDWTSVPDFDLFTYSSPCQDFSRAGQMRGGQENSGTRSSLLWECRKAIREKRPKFLILENVRDLVSSRFLPLFNSWIEELNEMGYDSKWQVICAADHKVPQNRQRTFLVSTRRFCFPDVESMTRKVCDVLDTHVGEQYIVDPFSIPCILKDQPSEDVLLVRQATRKGYIEVKVGGVFDASFPNSKTRRGRVQGDHGDICPTITASASESLLVFVGYSNGCPIVRRLTESELFKLMGLTDMETTLIQGTEIGLRQQRKMAGNSIVVDVLAGIFENLF